MRRYHRLHQLGLFCLSGLLLQLHRLRQCRLFGQCDRFGLLRQWSQYHPWNPWDQLYLLNLFDLCDRLFQWVQYHQLNPLGQWVRLRLLRRLSPLRQLRRCYRFDQ